MWQLEIAFPLPDEPTSFIDGPIYTIAPFLSLLINDYRPKYITYAI